jgi:hypothetical protein
MAPAALLAIAACVVALAACGDGGEEDVPAACTEGEDAIRAALRSAPGAARLDGDPLSECFAEDSDGGDLQRVGTGFLEAAAGLAASARRDPEGREALQLGYLVGAARRGASATQGIHTELLRRLEQEASTVGTRSRAFRRGERAGRTEG